MKPAFVFTSGVLGVGALMAGLSALGEGGQPAVTAVAKAEPPTQPASVPPGKFVSPDGSIRLPGDYRAWTHLGTWYVAEGKNGELDSHQVYAEPEAVAEFRRTGKWPHGATIVKEVRSTRSGKLTTGPGNWDGPIQQWFVMVKDTKKTFQGNPIWGRGWGWGLYMADDPNKNSCTDYKVDCLGCHVPAEKTDWIYKHGYPVLNETDGQLKKYMESIYSGHEEIDKPSPDSKEPRDAKKP